MSPSKKKAIKYTLFGIVAYLFFIVINMPAQFVYGAWKRWLGQDVPVKVSEIKGSIWKGRVGVASIDGQMLESLSYKLNPYTLLLGIAELDWEVKIKDGYAKGIMGYGIFGSTYFKNIEGWLPLSQLQVKALGGGNAAQFFRSARPGGDLDIALSSLKLEDNRVVAASGDLTWHTAEITLLKKLSLGDLKIKFEPTDQGIKGILSDQGGPLRAEGVLVLNADNTYEFNGAFGTRGLQPDLLNALVPLGKRGSDGKIKVSQKGQLAL